jgi:hypothetical protein
MSSEYGHAGARDGPRARRHLRIFVVRPHFLRERYLGWIHVLDGHGHQRPVLIDDVDGAVVRDDWRRRGGERPQRLLVVQRSRERKGHVGEKRLALHGPGCECFGLLPLRDVSCDLGGTYDLAVGVKDRRDRQRDGNHAPVEALAHRFEVVHTPPGPDRFEHGVLLGLSIGGDDDANRSTDDLLGCVAEHPFGSIVPRQNGTVQILADYRIVGGRHNRSQPARNLV